MRNGGIVHEKLGLGFRFSAMKHRDRALPPLNSKQPALAGAAHPPDFAAHIDKVEAPAGELAHGREIVAMDGRGCMRRGVPDPIEIAGMKIVRAFLVIATA